MLEQFRNVRVDLKNYTNKEETFMSEYTPRVEETMDSIIKIQGGIPNRGLYAPQMGYTFDYYERGKEQCAEGTVFLTNRGDFVVKIFHEHANTIGKRERIKAMLTKNINKEYICWPEDILLSSENNGEFVGYVMKHVRRPESLSDKIEELDLLSKTGDSKYDRRFLMQYCRKIAEQFRELHENNILVGDVNETNILVSSEDEEVYFVDTDSYQFDDYKALVGQEVYTSPEYMENSDDSEQLSYDKPRTIKDEQFAMAVMFYRILFLGAWPFKMCEGHVAEEIVTYRPHKEFDMVTFKGYNNINQVLNYLKMNVYVKRSDLELSKDEYILDDLVGLFIQENGEMLGKVEEIVYNGINILLSVVGENNFYIPKNGNFIKKVDLEKGIIETEGAKGLIL